MNGDKWQFAPGKDTNEKFVDIRVPSTWKNHEFNFNTKYGFAGSNYTYNRVGWSVKYTEGWYRLNFVIPNHWKDRGRIFLEVRRANHLSDFFLNGQKIGHHNTAYYPFRCDVTDYLKDIKINTLLIHIKDGNHVNFNIDETHSTTKKYIKELGGIEGDVLLRLLPDVRIENILIDTYIRKKELKVRYSIYNSTSKSLEIKIIPIVLNKDDSIVISFNPKTITILPQTTFFDTIETKWANPTFWGFGEYGKPYLYRLNIKLLDKDEILDNIEELFGFREFWSEGNKFYLNGKEIFLYGDNPGSGIRFLGVLNRYWMRFMIKAEREANINYIRTHTFIPPESWMDECDKLGMLLEPEFIISRDENFMIYERNLVEKVVKEFYNHPSIFMWSLDNESVSQGREINKEILEEHKRMSKIIREIDYNRLIDHQGDVYLGLAYNWGVDFYPQVFNMHPYGDPLEEKIVDYKRKFNYVDSVPIFIGEVCRSNVDKWLNNIEGLASDNIYAWEKYNDVASYFYRSIKGAESVGAKGVAPHKTLTLGYWGSVSPDSFVSGPFNFIDTSKIYQPLSWPAWSGFEPKVDNIYLWNWHSSQFNWFDETKPPYTTNFVHKIIGEAYRDITKTDIPAIDSIDFRNIIVYAPYHVDYVYFQDLSEFNPEVFGILPDKEGRAWFNIEKTGVYKIWYFTINGERKEKLLELKNIRIPISPGYKIIHINFNI